LLCVWGCVFGVGGGCVCVFGVVVCV